MFFQKAQVGFNHWWRYAIVLLAIMGGYVVGQIPLFLAIGRAQAEDDSVAADALAEFQNNPDFTLFGINNNMGLTLLLVTFLGAFTAFYFIFKPLHQREFRSIVTPSSRVNWSKILFGFFLWLGLSLVVEMLAYFLSPEDYIFQFKINTFIPLVLLSIFLLPVQTSMEEFVFRGYLMQGIGNSKLLRKFNLNIVFTQKRKP